MTEQQQPASPASPSVVRRSSLAPKRIVLSTFGSFGDVHPYVAVALELKARGHHPVIATSEIYREKIGAVGLEFHPVRPAVPSYDEPDEISRMLETMMDARKGPEEILNTLILPHLRDTYEDLSAAVGGGGADLFITHPLSIPAPLIVEQTGIAWVSCVLAPASMLSIYDPPVPPQLPALHKLMKLHHVFGRAVMRLGRWKSASLLEAVNKLRADVGLPPTSAHPLFEGQHSPALVLALFSRVLADPQPDWPPNTLVTGFPFYDRRDRAGDDITAGGGALSPELASFLDAGEPPIIFTLGSAAIWVAKDFYRESIAAARALGRRALLLTGHERNHPAEPLPAGVAAFEYAPYGAVLPRAAVVVHQGGVGTTGQTLRSGRPALVVPFSHDQFDNGARVARLGCGRTLARGRYHAASATRELRAILDDENYKINATRIGRRVQAEDGAAAACDAIEEVLARRG